MVERWHAIEEHVHTDGDYVLHEDYIKLDAERDELELVITAYQKLCSAYRLGRKAPEVALDVINAYFKREAK